MVEPKRWKKYFTDDPRLLEQRFHSFRLPEGHPWRCHGRCGQQQPPKRCPKISVRGYDYCVSHNPRLYKIRERKCGGHGARRHAIVSGYYSHGAGTALKQRMAELREMDPARRHSLAEEVDLARIAAERSVRLFEAACMGEEKASPDAQATALALLRQSIEHVSEIVTKAARTRRDSLETVDVEQLDYIVDQVVMILEDEVRPLGNDVVDRCKERFRQIKIPERKGAGGLDRAQVARMFREAATAIDESVQGGAPAEQEAS